VALGFFARSIENDLGIGKILAIDEREGTIEYFYSVGKRECQIVERSSLRRVQLPYQTRCYFYQEEIDGWITGRIGEWDEEEKTYSIDLPDRRTMIVRESQIYIRCDRPIDDPIDTLGMKGQETPYFHSLRSALVRSLLKQRAVSQGMTGLLSANIALYPHQVEVARRVLEDPIQRYLLADEVGLGKTIEAGIILRQFLLDDPLGKALILVPSHLIYQWQKELEDKFYISRFPERVTIRVIEDWRSIKNPNLYSFVIIDEAHHVASMMRTNPAGFERVKTLALNSDRLLLLSATPVLDHEEDFLVLLHLLDADTYGLGDLDGLRERVTRRQEIGRILLAFTENTPDFVLQKNLDRLQNLFPEDSYLLAQIEEAKTDIDNPEKIRVIRTYVSDTYRLHRRLLRNRRECVEDVIFDRSAVPRLEYDLDERVYSLHQLLDEWRIAAPDTEKYQQVFRILFSGSGTWLGVLQKIVKTRLQGRIQKDLAESKILVEVPKFEGEEEILQGILRLLATPSEEGDRLELLKVILLYRLADLLSLQSFRSDLEKLQQRIRLRLENPYPGDRLPKIIIFTSFTASCTAIADFLGQIFGKDSVTIHRTGENRETVEKNVDRFQNNSRCFLLVADSSGEEGRNLQFIDGIIHFDLPLSPNRLEQRFGRFDRIGGKRQIDSWLLIGSDLEDSFSFAWYTLLKDGFNIFQSSIASLQFYVEKKVPELAAILFQEGARGICEVIPIVVEEIERERVKLSEQNALDEIDARSEIARTYFENLENYDDQHQNLEKAIEGWLCNGLSFQRIYSKNLAEVRRYRGTMKTLVPSRELKKYFAEAMQYEGIYNRRLANQSAGVNLYRIGEPLIDNVASYLDWDDRGKAFAMWRKDSQWDSSEGGEWVGFRFDYRIEIDAREIRAVLGRFSSLKMNKPALQRRGDALFPPFLETLFLDRNGQPVEEESLGKILKRRYKGKGSGDRDYNLAKERLPILDRFVAPQQWRSLCLNARETSEQILRESPRFTECCRTRTESAKRLLDTRIHQWQCRGDRFDDTNELELEIALREVFLAALASPRVQLDAVGFIILSGRSPSGEEEYER
jgi:ATP-dependent helicase HepA